MLNQVGVMLSSAAYPAAKHVSLTAVYINVDSNFFFTFQAVQVWKIVKNVVHLLYCTNYIDTEDHLALHTVPNSTFTLLSGLQAV